MTTQVDKSAPCANAPGTAIGTWDGGEKPLLTGSEGLRRALAEIAKPFALLWSEGSLAAGFGGQITLNGQAAGHGMASAGLPAMGFVPASPMQALGDSNFCSDHGLRFPYVTGAMANGIGSTAVVEAMARAGMLGFFGSAGLPLREVEAAVLHLSKTLGDQPFGFNFIHSPNEPAVEAAVAECYVQNGIQLIEASAFLDITLPLVRYRVAGIHRDASGAIVAPNRIIAKVSRIEVAQKFFSPPPEKHLRALVEKGIITHEQAELAGQIPMAQDLTAEADSGGHTDNRPAITLIPTMIALRDRMQAQWGYPMPLRVGAAGGIATPASAAAAFAMGAAYIVTGSINQACVEAGTSDAVREMLAQTEQADVTMAPAADMFEMGVTVQVLKRGTMFAMRAARLYELYRKHDGLDAIPQEERSKLEKTVFQAPFDTVWDQTRAFFQDLDPRQVERAERDPKHKMALVFRWYLGQSSTWANRGVDGRKIDYQIWCGPAMGAFNEWVKGSHLEQAGNRRVADIAMNILYGAAYLTRVNSAQRQGISLPPEVMRTKPLMPETIEEYVR